MLLSIASNDLQIEVDKSGRLIVIDASDTSTPEDIDRDKFNETIIINHKDALSLINGKCELLITGIREKLQNWKLTAEALPLGKHELSDSKLESSDNVDESSELGIAEKMLWPQRMKVRHQTPQRL